MRIGLIGAGYIGKVHLNALRMLPFIKDVIVVDSDIDTAENLKQHYGFEKACADYRELIDDNTVDVIHNCTPNNMHFEVNKAFLEAGKHVLSEKPLCTDSRQAEILVKTAEKEKLVTGINFCYRYYPAVQEAALRIRENMLGRIRAVSGHFFQDWLFNDTDYSWRLEKEKSGISNAIADIGSHWCDMLSFLTGEEIGKLTADIETLVPVRKKPVGKIQTFGKAAEKESLEDVNIELEDYGSVLFRLKNGGAGNFSVCQLCAGKKVELEIKLFGDKASFEWSHTNPAVYKTGYRDKESRTFSENGQLQHEKSAGFARLPAGHPMGYLDAVYNLFSEFYNQVLTGKPINFGVPDFRDGLNIIKITECIIKSAETGSWLKVE